MQRSYTQNSKISSMSKKKMFDILIVDDDKDFSHLLKTLLELRGHNVLCVDEGVLCISSCKNKSYDIIFMDYHIKDIDGVQIVDFIKDIYKSHSIIFAYTGDNSKNALDKFKKIGMNGALIKPVEMTVLESVMNTLEERGCVDEIIFSKLSKKSKGSLVVF